MPVDALKIDRSFLGAGVRLDVESVPIVQTITTLAHGLGLDVVAEGVHTTAQLEQLRDVGCDYAQGFLFSQPVEAGSAEALISAEPRW